jgi:hypothetical protein
MLLQRLSSVEYQYGNGLGQAAKMAMGVETKQRLVTAIRACCEAIAHERGLAVSTRSQVMVCPAAGNRRAPALALMQSAASCGVSWRAMASGGGHDSQEMAVHLPRHHALCAQY